MIPSLLGFNDSEETRGLPINLQLITIYSYSDCFILKMSPAIQRVRTNLVIHKKSATINITSSFIFIKIGKNHFLRVIMPNISFQLF